MTCFHCQKEIEFVTHCRDWFAEEDGVNGYNCSASNEGDHEPENEDAQ